MDGDSALGRMNCCSCRPHDDHGAGSGEWEAQNFFFSIYGTLKKSDRALSLEIVTPKNVFPNRLLFSKHLRFLNYPAHRVRDTLGGFLVGGP